MWKQKNLPSYLEDSTLVKIYFSVLKILFRTMIPLNLSSEERWNSMDQSKGWVFWTLNKIIIELDGPLSVKTNQRKCWSLPVFSSSTMDYLQKLWLQKFRCVMHIKLLYTLNCVLTCISSLLISTDPPPPHPIISSLRYKPLSKWIWFILTFWSLHLIIIKNQLMQNIFWSARQWLVSKLFFYSGYKPLRYKPLHLHKLS